MLVMPLRDEAILQRQHELQHSHRRHEALLRAIFETTLSSLEISQVKQPQKHDLASFLEANNLSRGRSFDPKSLPPTDSLSGYANALRIDSSETQDEIHKGLVRISSDQGKLSQDRDHVLTPDEHFGVPDPNTTPVREDASLSWPPDSRLAQGPVLKGSFGAQGHDINAVKEVDLLEGGSYPMKNSYSSPGSGLCSSEGLPLTSTDAELVQMSTLKDPGAEQQSENARVLPQPREVQENHLEHLDQETDDGKELGGSGLTAAITHAHGFTPPTSEEDAGRRSSEDNARYEDNQPPPTGKLKSKLDIGGAEIIGGTESTPDEQLRLEEAQSLQLSNAIHDGGKESRSIPPPASLSSEFIHDSMVDGTTIPDVSGLDDEAVAKQHVEATNAGNKQSELPGRPTAGLRDHMRAGLIADSPQDLTLSRRPPMRIDTGVSLNSESSTMAAMRSNVTTLPSASDTATPSKMAAGSAQSPPERMTTRVSSGALRHKSVSEILGETPKATPTQAEKGPFARESGDLIREGQHSLQTPKSASSITSPDPTTFRQRLTELKEKERSKLSTVVFASSRNTEVSQTQSSEADEVVKQDRDYMLTLFNFQTVTPPRAHHLSNLIKSAHKTLTTADHLTELREKQACRVLQKIYDLQARSCWSLRQIERAVEPVRPVTHQDVLLGELKWMRTDFKEERRWKHAAAKFIADACAVWVASKLDERRSLQVKVRTHPTRMKSRLDSVSTPDLVPSTDDEVSEATDDECIHDPASAPAAIFSLPPEMFVFGLSNSPIAENLLLELPIYQPNVEYQNAALLSAPLEPDAMWKKDIVPISKYAQGKLLRVSNSAQGRIVSVEEGPLRKRSRFDYQQTDARCSNSKAASDENFEKILEPEQDDVALFNSEYKHIRDRIHIGHAFKPPSDYPMPSQSFFEARSSSQWTQAEDDELRRIVKEYSYNWSLISSSMTPPSLFTSGAERRTPWECFERWISLEGLPVEMAKINYFRAYHARLQAAQKTVESNQLAQQQQQGGVAQLPRRRTTQPYSVDRRKDQKHMHLIDAMRKLAKKRETALTKQQHVATMSAMRKAQEPPGAPKIRKEIHTPQQFSRLKYQQVLQLEERAKQYRIQVMQQQKAAQAARANQQNNQHTNGLPPVRNLIPGGPNNSSPNMTAVNTNGQTRGGPGDPSRGVPQMQRIGNGQTNGILPTNSHSMPHAPMHSNAQVQMQMQQRMAPGIAPDPRVLQEVSQVQAQQRAYQQQVRQQSHTQTNGHAVSPNMQNPSLPPQSGVNLLASNQGRSSPSINGVPPVTGSSTSPRMNQPQALSSGMTPAVNHISSQVKARHPQASPEQITRMTTDQLYKMSEARHHAMQAAAGNANLNAVASNSNVGLQAQSPMQHATMMANGGSPILNQAHYAQIMRTQQASQQRVANVGNGQNSNGNGMNGTGRNGSRSVTPLIQRTSSAQGGPRPSQSPSTRPVGLA